MYLSQTLAYLSLTRFSRWSVMSFRFVLFLCGGRLGRAFCTLKLWPILPKYVFWVKSSHSLPPTVARSADGAEQTHCAKIKNIPTPSSWISWFWYSELFAITSTRFSIYKVYLCTPALCVFSKVCDCITAAQWRHRKLKYSTSFVPLILLFDLDHKFTVFLSRQ